MRYAVALLFCLLLPVAAAAQVSGTLKSGGAPVADAVVYLEGGTADEVPARHVVMDQKSLRFTPRVLVVRRGTEVEFTNSDDVQHNVFSPSTTNRFNLGSYNRGETRSVKLDRAGEVVVLCNIHMEMEAHIVVVDGPYFALSGPSGTFAIADVPPGQYTLKIWRSGWLPETRPVDVAAGEPAVVDVDLHP